MIGDAGWWIALERGDRRAWAHLEILRREGVAPVTSAAVLAQVWRGDARQQRLQLVLRAADVVDLDAADAREVGALIGSHGGSDVVDGHVAVLAARYPTQTVLTSDRDDLVGLGVPADRIVEV